MNQTTNNNNLILNKFVEKTARPAETKLTGGMKVKLLNADGSNATAIASDAEALRQLGYKTFELKITGASTTLWGK